jgi:hypothetical protein
VAEFFLGGAMGFHSEEYNREKFRCQGTANG